MSEIEKLYKNAGVEKQYYYFDSADGNTYTWELNENGNDKHNMCFIGKPKIKDREFTAEKQLSLIKWLARFNVRIEYTESKYFIESHYHGYSVYIECFEEALAGFINNLWQNLTEEEKEQIRSILNG